MKHILTALALAALASAAVAAAEMAESSQPALLCIPPAVAHVLT